MGIAQRQIKAERVPDSGQVLNRQRFGKPPETLGERIRHWRKIAGIDQRQLARATGIARRRIQKIEADAVDADDCEISAIERAIDFDNAVLEKRGQH